MDYQISGMGAVVIIAYSIIVLVFFLWPLSSLFRKFIWGKVTVLLISLVLLAAPWVEEYWIASNFSRVCKDAGVHVYKKVKAQGFYDATRFTPNKVVFPAYGRELDASGFTFMEFNSSDEANKIVHTEKKDGEWSKEVIDQPRARYQYKYSTHPRPHVIEEQIGWKLEKMETVVVDIKNGDILGRDTTYRRTANLAEGLWRLPWGLSKTTCRGSAPQPPKLRHLLYRYVLTPSEH